MHAGGAVPVAVDPPVDAVGRGDRQGRELPPAARPGPAPVEHHVGHAVEDLAEEGPGHRGGDLVVDGGGLRLGEHLPGPAADEGGGRRDPEAVTQGAGSVEVDAPLVGMGELVGEELVLVVDPGVAEVALDVVPGHVVDGVGVEGLVEEVEAGREGDDLHGGQPPVGLELLLLHRDWPGVEQRRAELEVQRVGGRGRGDGRRGRRRGLGGRRGRGLLLGTRHGGETEAGGDDGGDGGVRPAHEAPLR